jgi:hypothetical protein
MNRDQGLRRTTVITGALIAASLAGTVGVGIAAHAASTISSATDASSRDSGNTSTSTADSPSITSNDDSGGSQATSGGS